jgi:hypothetical protein
MSATSATHAPHRAGLSAGVIGISQTPAAMMIKTSGTASQAGRRPAGGGAFTAGRMAVGVPHR